MRRAPLASLVACLPIAIASFAAPAYAQPTPLPTLPPPTPAAAPSTLNPNSTPNATANATVTPPAVQYAPPPPPSPPIDITSSPATVTQVSAPYVAAEPEPAAPIACAGPGAFTHDGFYLRLSSGIGGLAVGGSGPTGSPKLSGFASSTMLAIGGTPSRGFVVGGAVAARSLSSVDTSNVPGDVTSVQASQLGVFVDWFPSLHRGWHVGGLLGVGTIRIQTAAQEDQVNLSFAGQAFGGYDFWIGPEWSLGIQGVLGFSTQSPMMDDNRNDTGYSLGSVSGAVEATLLFH
jgi:hypothetical protein